jgi:predicted N-acyltransferase
VAYGRYWGALERVDCLHFEACYYQPHATGAFEHGVASLRGRRAGRAQDGARPDAGADHGEQRTGWRTRTFADAVERFLAREGQGVGEYLDHLQARSPLRKDSGP